MGSNPAASVNPGGEGGDFFCRIRTERETFPGDTTYFMNELQQRKVQLFIYQNFVFVSLFFPVCFRLIFPSVAAVRTSDQTKVVNC